MLFNFYNFFAFIFEFSTSGRVRTDRKEIFFVLHLSARPYPLLLEMKPGWCFLIFRIVLHLFLNFLSRVGSERIGRKFFFFSIFRHVQARVVLKCSLDDVFLIFKIFWNLFLNFLTRVGFERIGRKFFFFSIFQPVHTRFLLKWSLDDVF